MLGWPGTYTLSCMRLVLGWSGSMRDFMLGRWWEFAGYLGLGKDLPLPICASLTATRSGSSLRRNIDMSLPKRIFRRSRVWAVG